MVHAGRVGMSGACRLDICDPEVSQVDLVRRGQSKTRDWQCDEVRVPDGAGSGKGGRKRWGQVVVVGQHWQNRCAADQGVLNHARKHWLWQGELAGE